MQWEKEEGRKVSECMTLAAHREPSGCEQEHEGCGKHQGQWHRERTCQEAPQRSLPAGWYHSVYGGSLGLVIGRGWRVEEGCGWWETNGSRRLRSSWEKNWTSRWDLGLIRWAKHCESPAICAQIGLPCILLQHMRRTPFLPVPCFSSPRGDWQPFRDVAMRLGTTGVILFHIESYMTARFWVRLAPGEETHDCGELTVIFLYLLASLFCWGSQSAPGFTDSLGLPSQYGSLEHSWLLSPWIVASPNSEVLWM